MVVEVDIGVGTATFAGAVGVASLFCWGELTLVVIVCGG